MGTKYLIIFEDGSFGTQDKLLAEDLVSNQDGVISIIDMYNSLYMDKDGEWVVINQI